MTNEKLIQTAKQATHNDTVLQKGIINLLCQALEASDAQVKQLAAENVAKQEFIATCFRAAADGGSMDGSDIQELGERLGLFERQTYQPALHGYICGHEPGEDTVYVMKKSPATDAFLASLRAEGLAMVVKYHKERAEALKEVDRQGAFYHSRASLDASDVAAQLRSQSEQVKGVQS